MSEVEVSIDRLVRYCRARNVFLHPSVEAKKIQGRGLGVYSREQLELGERLVHVPTKEIFTIANIPNTFLDKSARVDLAVHAQLAAFLAFGGDALAEYEPWLSTWPAMEDFTDTMPMFWGENIVEELQKLTNVTGSTNGSGESKEHLVKRRKAETKSIVDGVDPFSSCNSETKQPDLVDTPLLLPSALGEPIEASKDVNSSTGLVPQMVSKVAKHIGSVSNALPHLNLTCNHANLTRFLHAWCQVNTRCFYYILPTTSIRAIAGKRKQSVKTRVKPKPPSDPNEAMALCPFMDLFNHISPATQSAVLSNSSSAALLPCEVELSSTGFTISTKSTTQPDLELLLSYGPHTNDTLWTEYGFLLPGSTNSSDSTPLDRIVLSDPRLNEQGIECLKEQGYLANYTLAVDGSACYRTEMAAWLLILGSTGWIRVVEQGLDPQDIDLKHGEGHYNSHSGRSAKREHNQVIMGWLTRLLRLAENSISNLATLSTDELLTHFSTLSVVASSQLSQSRDNDKLALARRRRNMCVVRWEQIKTMSEAGLARAKEADIRE